VITRISNPDTTTTTTTSSSNGNGAAAGAGVVVGCIDIRLPSSVTGAPAIGVPEGDAQGCYLLNVVVEEDSRGQGLGKSLMRAAIRRAVQQWGAERLYTHVEADNEVGTDKCFGFRC
jgi:ribosomal protein S18 acetylase RimI-like enzyme